MPPWAVGLLAPLGFTLWWVVLLSALGALLGWGRLARHYRAGGPFDGTPRRFRSGKIGLSNFSGCLTVGANPTGLYLAVLFPFRPGHPPLFIPWEDVVATPVEGWLTHALDLRFAKAPRVAVRLPAALGREIAADANRAWAGADGSPQ